MINSLKNSIGIGSAVRLMLNLIYRVKEPSYKQFRKLENWQGLGEESVQQFQKERLKKIIFHAYYHVPYYRQILISAKVINKYDKVNLDYFVNIPLLDKDKIFQNYDDLKSNDLKSRKWYENTSGGSTGRPVRLIQDSDYATWRSAVKILHNQWTGCKSGEKKLLLWGSERDLFYGKERLKVRYGRWLRNEIWVNAFKMSSADMSDCVNKINTFKPVQILAYAGSIYELARYIERKDLKVFSPNAIMSTAGTLYPQFRETIERVFKSPVYNRYGSREVGDIACECERHKGLHISVPTHYVEIVNRDGVPVKTGEIGEIVVTLLTNFAMPLIRYRIGDMGIWSEQVCPCGRNWPLVKEIKGRVTDIFLTKNGDLIDGEFFTHLIYFQDWVKKFQVIQEDYNYIKFIIAPNKSGSDDQSQRLSDLTKIKNKVKKVMGGDCKIEFEFVNDIDKSKSGKYRYTISKVPNPYR